MVLFEIFWWSMSDRSSSSSYKSDIKTWRCRHSRRTRWRDCAEELTWVRISTCLSLLIRAQTIFYGSDLIFPITKLISFLSQGTTLPAGTVILTGWVKCTKCRHGHVSLSSCNNRTPAGVGWTKNPRKLLRDGTEFRVHVSHGVGTLINKIKAEHWHILPYPRLTSINYDFNDASRPYL